MSSQLVPFPLLPGAVPTASCSLHPFPDSKLGELEEKLAKVELEGQNQTFGKATVHVTVLRVQPMQAPRHLAFASQREVGPAWAACPGGLGPPASSPNLSPDESLLCRRVERSMGSRWTCQAAYL